jgi:hypothetical protein
MTQARPPLVHRECLLDDAAPRVMARAAVRARLTAPLFVGYLIVAALVGLLLLATGPVGLGIGVLGVVVLLPLLTFAQVGRTARAFAARGYRPGTTVSADWGPDSFVVTTSLAHATYFYRDIRAVRRTGSAVFFRMRAARLLVLLPSELVPSGVRSLVAAGQLPA